MYHVTLRARIQKKCNFDKPLRIKHWLKSIFFKHNHWWQTHYFPEFFFKFQPNVHVVVLCISQSFQIKYFPIFISTNSMVVYAYILKNLIFKLLLSFDCYGNLVKVLKILKQVFRNGFKYIRLHQTLRVCQKFTSRNVS